MNPDSKRILVLTNAIAGRGRAATRTAAAERELSARGHAVRTADARSLNGNLADALIDTDLLLIAGGDGTVLHALPTAARLGTPVYHLGTGNENLLARQLGHTGDARRVADAVDAWRVQPMDLGVCTQAGGDATDAAEPIWFATMLSVGPDAAIVHRLAAARTGTVWHGSYVRPTLAEALRPTLPPLRVEVDGETIANGVRGMAIVANTRQYAVRLDPAHRADPADGLLDVVVLPARSVAGLAWRLGRARVRWHGPRVIRARGESVRIESLGDRPAAVQLDGEAPGVHASDASAGLCTPIQVNAKPASLRVLRG